MKTKLLILGGFGFIGTNLIKYIDLHLDSYDVIVFDRNMKHPHNITFNSVSKVYSGDFSNMADLEQVFQNEKIDIIIHCISTTIPATSVDFRFDIESNLISTVQLLELQIKHNVNKIIYISSGGAIYGDANQIIHSETEIPNPISSYGINKLGIEKYIYLFHKLYSMNYLILRLSNPFGPFHYSYKQGIINVASRLALEGKTFPVWGDGTAEKDYIYILDFCSILFRLLEKNINNTILNVGSGKSSSLMEILDRIKMEIPDFSWSFMQQNKYDVVHFGLNIERIYSILDDIALTSLDDGIQKTIDWLKHE